MNNISILLSYVLLPILFWGIGNPILNAQMVLNPKFEKKIDATIDRTIPLISCKLLHQKIQRENSNIYILDAREIGEYQVSHLPNAIHIGYDDFKPKTVKDLPKDANLVIYCSIGYRSEKIGEKLKKMGFQKVYNLYGGIFEWSNATFPLQNSQDQKTNKVHTYNKDWAQWLDKGVKVY